MRKRQTKKTLKSGERRKRTLITLSSGIPEKISKATTPQEQTSRNTENITDETEKTTDFVSSAPPPTRTKNGDLVFADQPTFRPNLTPMEVMQMGSFGGTYFRPIYSSVTKKKYSGVWKELPFDWLKGLNIKSQVASPSYQLEVNKYKVKCGGSLEMWEQSGWMHPQDPFGWFQWYCRFYQGRRTGDDKRQISRWNKCTGPTGRWRNNLITKCVRAGCAFDNIAVSPVVRQTLQHWAYILTENHFSSKAKQVSKKLLK